MTQLEFKVTGMSCAACSARVEKAVKALPGAENVCVNLLTGTMTLDAENTLSESEIIKAVTDAGYGAYSSGRDAHSAAPEPDEKAELKHKKQVLIWSFVLLIPLLYVSMGHMVGLPLPNALSLSGNPASFGLLQFILCLPIAVINSGYYIRGFRALIKRSPNMDSLIALGSGASLIYGIFGLFMINAGHTGYAHSLYFESAVMILALINLGKYLEALSKGRSGDALKSLSALTPLTALREEGGAEVDIPASDIRVGDILRVLPGARIPADGVIIEGSASIDESMLTGESMPVFKREGASVSCATVNTDAFFRMRVTAAGDDSALSRIVRMVEKAAASKPPIARLADRIAGIFVPCVMGIALVTLAVWLLKGTEFAYALTRAISVLVVSCPCALGLATPVAVMVGMGRGAEEGILFRSGEALEHTGEIDTLITDKTGTLTRGEPVITRALPFGVTQNELIRLAASVEAQSEHPLAKAVRKCAADANLLLYKAQNTSVLPGRGISAQINEKTLLCASPDYTEQAGIDISPCGEVLKVLTQNGETPLLVSEGSRLIGLIALADAPRDTAPATVSELKKLNVNTVMLTGDNAATARAVAADLGIKDVISGVLPDGKLEIVESLRAAGKRCAMLGDGINDAPALKAAYTGIAIGAGTDAALESADVVLIKSEPLSAVNAVLLSRKVITNIKQNLFWAFFYNILMIPAAAGVYGLSISPMLCAAAMSVSSLFVVTNALRLRRFVPVSAEIGTVSPRFKALELKKEETRMVTLKIEGMMCMHCVARVKKALEAAGGVEADVNLEKGTAKLQLPEGADTAALVKAVVDAGYEVTEVE